MSNKAVDQAGWEMRYRQFFYIFIAVGMLSSADDYQLLLIFGIIGDLSYESIIFVKSMALFEVKYIQLRCLNHWNKNVVILIKLSSLAALKVVKNDNFQYRQWWWCHQNDNISISTCWDTPREETGMMINCLENLFYITDSCTFTMTSQASGHLKSPASEITSNLTVFSTVCLGWHQRNHQSWYYCPFGRGTTGNQWIPLTKGK